jgi:hypothetical protein
VDASTPLTQRRGIGLFLLSRAKALSPSRLELWTFQRNSNARAFYKSTRSRKQNFHLTDSSDGQNEENETDVKYEWKCAQ